jgi:hypothetical protein
MSLLKLHVTGCGLQVASTGLISNRPPSTPN